MLEFTKDNFADEVLQAKGLVVVDFWGENCDHCLELMPDFEKLAEKYADKAKFGKVNIKGNRRLAMGQQVMGLPSIVFYFEGEKKEHLSGDDVSAEVIENSINKYI